MEKWWSVYYVSRDMRKTYVDDIYLGGRRREYIMHPSWHQSPLWHRATQRRPSFVIIFPHEEDGYHGRCEFSSARRLEKFGVGPGLLSLRLSGLKERRGESEVQITLFSSSTFFLGNEDK